MVIKQLANLLTRIKGTSPIQIAALPTEEVDPFVDNLWGQLPLPEFSVRNLQQWTQQDLESKLTGNPLLDNAILNKWEFAHGITVLKSYPWRLSVPFILCNAQCDFCRAWLVKGNIPPLDELMTALTPMIRHCYSIDLVGWGEPLIHPQFSQVLNIVQREAEPRARIALTTNGVHLQEWYARLLDANVMDYAISIHAATPATHQDLMGLKPGDFERIQQAIRELAAHKPQFPKLNIGLAFVVTQQNIAEIPAFLEMGKELGVDQIHLRTLIPVDGPIEGLDYHRLPPYLHPEFESLRDAAVEAISQSPLSIIAEPSTWSTPVFPPEWEAQLDTLPLTERKDRSKTPLPEVDWEQLGAGNPFLEQEPYPVTANPYNRRAPLYCPSPYTAFYVNGTQRQVNPCCYMQHVPNHELIYFKPSMTFEEVWNSPAMVAVRRSLHEGPLMPACLKCPFYY